MTDKTDFEAIARAANPQAHRRTVEEEADHNGRIEIHRAETIMGPGLMAAAIEAVRANGIEYARFVTYGLISAAARSAVTAALSDPAKQSDEEIIRDGVEWLSWAIESALRMHLHAQRRHRADRDKGAG